MQGEGAGARDVARRAALRASPPQAACSEHAVGMLRLAVRGRARGRALRGLGWRHPRGRCSLMWPTAHEGEGEGKGGGGGGATRRGWAGAAIVELVQRSALAAPSTLAEYGAAEAAGLSASGGGGGWRRRCSWWMTCSPRGPRR